MIQLKGFSVILFRQFFMRWKLVINDFCIWYEYFILNDRR